jgi:hypothetical protein
VALGTWSDDLTNTPISCGCTPSATRPRSQERNDSGEFVGDAAGVRQIRDDEARHPSQRLDRSGYVFAGWLVEIEHHRYEILRAEGVTERVEHRLAFGCEPAKYQHQFGG